MGSANERRRYKVASSLIGRTHAQNDPCSTNPNKARIVNASGVLGVQLVYSGDDGNNFTEIVQQPFFY